jgi:hypothetical protein
MPLWTDSRWPCSTPGVPTLRWRMHAGEATWTLHGFQRGIVRGALPLPEEMT